MKLIPLSKRITKNSKNVGLFAMVDDEDFDAISKYSWYAQKDTHTYYANKRKNANGCPYSHMHRFVLQTLDTSVHVDHIDGNGLNNQKSNLRIATHSQNAANKRKISGTSSAYRGVSWRKRQKRWEVVVGSKYIGQYKDETLAAKMYDKFAFELFGEYARLNFPQKSFP